MLRYNVQNAETELSTGELDEGFSTSRGILQGNLSFSLAHTPQSPKTYVNSQVRRPEGRFLLVVQVSRGGCAFNCFIERPASQKHVSSSRWYSFQILDVQKFARVAWGSRNVFQLEDGLHHRDNRIQQPLGAQQFDDFPSEEGLWRRISWLDIVSPNGRLWANWFGVSSKFTWSGSGFCLHQHQPERRTRRPDHPWSY